MEEYIEEAIKVSRDPEFLKLYNLELEVKEKSYDHGMYDGIYEAQAEIAKRMLKEQMDHDLIMKLTSLSIPKFEDILEKVNNET